MLWWRAYWEGYGMCNTPATPDTNEAPAGSPAPRRAPSNRGGLPAGVYGPDLHLAPPDVHPGDGRPLVHVGPEVDVPNPRGVVDQVPDIHMLHAVHPHLPGRIRRHARIARVLRVHPVDVPLPVPHRGDLEGVGVLSAAGVVCAEVARRPVRAGLDLVAATRVRVEEDELVIAVAPPYPGIGREIRAEHGDHFDPDFLGDSPAGEAQTTGPDAVVLEHGAHHREVVPHGLAERAVGHGRVQHH